MQDIDTASAKKFKLESSLHDNMCSGKTFARKMGQAVVMKDKEIVRQTKRQIQCLYSGPHSSSHFRDHIPARQVLEACNCQ